MSRLHPLRSHREVMSRYYRFHSSIYDATRWAFLFGRTRLISELLIRPGYTVLEIGCGTGRNFGPIQSRLQCRGRLLGTDCSEPMLSRAEARVMGKRWHNVEVVAGEYVDKPIAAGLVDIVILSYSLSMMPDWHRVLKSAKAELKPGGRLGVVDFCFEHDHALARWFADWLRFNHVEIERPFENVLTSMFELTTFNRVTVFGGLWTYFRFVGTKVDPPVRN